MVSKVFLLAMLGVAGLTEASAIRPYDSVMKKRAQGGATQTCLAANALQTASNSDGAPSADAGQSNSLADPANFINFCSGQTLTNGLQNTNGSCNGVVMGQIPAKAKMVSSILINPQHADEIPANTDFKIQVQVSNFQPGNFTNAADTYYSAPQQINGTTGVIIGHTHVTIQSMGNTFNPTTPLDATQFVFFKGINDVGNGNGLLSATVTGGLPAGKYRVCSMTSASNHQPVLMPVAQRGAQDDCNKFTVVDNGSSKNTTTGTSTASAAGKAATSAATKVNTSAAAAAQSATSGSGKGSAGGKAGNGAGGAKAKDTTTAAAQGTTAAAQGTTVEVQGATVTTAATATTQAAAAGGCGGGKVKAGSSSSSASSASVTSSASSSSAVSSASSSAAAAAVVSSSSASKVKTVGAAAVTTTASASASASVATTLATSVSSSATRKGGATMSALGGMSAPRVTGSADATRPFGCEGASFANRGDAVQRACDSQATTCTNAVNAGQVPGVTIQMCNEQKTQCMEDLQ